MVPPGPSNSLFINVGVACEYTKFLVSIEALRCLLFHGDGGHIGGQNCIESIEAALQYGRHHYGKSKQRKASMVWYDRRNA